MPLAAQSLGSGSSGNALLLDSSAGAVLVDCGIGPRSLARGLAAANRRLDEIVAVLVTHEHIDHIRSVRALTGAGAYFIASAGTATAASLPTSQWQEIRPAQSARFAGFEVTALPVSHDAEEPCGFHIASADGGKVVVLTDLGCRDDALLDPLSEADLIVLEANHDVAMLRQGPYPAYLKRRVLSSTGHLSNADCGALLAAGLRNAATPGEIWLAHLSQTNNRPSLAVDTVRQTLANGGVAASVTALPRQTLGPRWQSGSARTAPPISVQMQIPGF